MGHYCSAYGCNNTQNKYAGRSFHGFPFKDKALLRKWLKAIRRVSFTPSTHSRICSDHFVAKNYQIRPGAAHPRLRYDAVPSIFAFPDRQQERKPNCPIRVQTDTVIALPSSLAEHSYASSGETSKNCSLQETIKTLQKRSKNKRKQRKQAHRQPLKGAIKRLSQKPGDKESSRDVEAPTTPPSHSPEHSSNLMKIAETLSLQEVLSAPEQPQKKRTKMVKILRQGPDSDSEPDVPPPTSAASSTPDQSQQPHDNSTGTSFIKLQPKNVPDQNSLPPTEPLKEQTNQQDADDGDASADVAAATSRKSVRFNFVEHSYTSSMEGTITKLRARNILLYKKVKSLQLKSRRQQKSINKLKDSLTSLKLSHAKGQSLLPKGQSLLPPRTSEHLIALPT